MKISPHDVSSSSPAADAATLARANAEAGAAAARARSAKLPETGSSSVQLSATAMQLLGGTAAGDFDAAKVERIRRSIADGSYKIDAEKIADKLIANAQETLSAVKR